MFSAVFELLEEEEGAEGSAPSSGKSGSVLKEILEDVEIAPILTIGSAQPVNPLVGIDANRSQAYPLSARPLRLGRNALHTPGSATLDLRIVKYIPIGRGRLDLVVEFFNLLNRRNIAEINPFFGTGLTPASHFGRPLTSLSARQVQFALDFEF